MSVNLGVDTYVSSRNQIPSTSGADVREPIFTWNPEVLKQDQRVSTSALIIGLHGPGADFLRCCCSSEKTIGSIVLREISLKGYKLSEGAGGNATCDIVSVGSGDAAVLFLVCGHAIPEDRASLWTKVLFENVHAAKVVVLDSIPAAKYLMQRRLGDGPVLRTLATDAFTHDIAVPMLEAPNIVQGACASIISHVQLESGAAAVFMSIPEHGSSRSLSSFEQLLPFYFGEAGGTLQPSSKYSQFAVRNISDLQSLYV